MKFDFDLKPLVIETVETVLDRRDRLDRGLPDVLTYSEADAAKLLGLEKHQLRDLRLSGRISSLDGFGRSIRYGRREILRVAGEVDA